MAGILTLKCFGAGKEAIDAYENFLADFGRHEIEIERWYDQHMCGTAFCHKIFQKNVCEFFGA